MSRDSKAGEVVERVRGLRLALRLSQEEFAKELRPDVSRVAVVHWETGRSEPSASTYLKLARLAKDDKALKDKKYKNFVGSSAAIWFWERAGVDQETVRFLIPEFDKLLREHEGRLRQQATSKNAAVIPLITRLGTSFLENNQLNSADVSELLELPEQWFRNPSSTFCMRGAPRADGFDLLFIDRSQTDVANLEEAAVLVFFVSRDKGEPSHFVLGRLVLSVHSEHAGRPEVAPEMESYESLQGLLYRHSAFYLPKELDLERGDRIVGRVVLRVVSPLGGPQIKKSQAFRAQND